MNMTTTLAPRFGFRWARSARPADVAAEPTAVPTDADDRLRQELMFYLERQPSWDASRSNAFVAGGKVILQGVFPSAANRSVARRIALEFPGVQEVVDARVARREWQGSV